MTTAIAYAALVAALLVIAAMWAWLASVVARAPQLPAEPSWLDAQDDAGLTMCGRTAVTPRQDDPGLLAAQELALMLGDSCERLAEVDADSVGLSVYSPPFASLFDQGVMDFDTDAKEQPCTTQ